MEPHDTCGSAAFHKHYKRQYLFLSSLQLGSVFLCLQCGSLGGFKTIIQFINSGAFDSIMFKLQVIDLNTFSTMQN